MSVAARASPLSQAQVQEVYSELRTFFPHITLTPHLVKSLGDRDQKTSLRTLDKTDFFTREIDQCVIDGICHVAVHSAKDLPELLPPELKRVALTRGVDPADVVVLREGDDLVSLSAGSSIATSSERRETMVKQLRSDLTFVDIRGTIEKRLEKLFRKEIDGVVVAMAALIRLKLTHLNHVRLLGETVPFQGRLAVLARKDDQEMQELFAAIDG